MSDGRGKHLYTNHRGLAMSTLKTTFIQHPSAVSPSIELTPDGALSFDASAITTGKIDQARLPMKKIAAFTGSGTWTVPAGVTYAIAHMLGGGGSGGVGATGNPGGSSSVAFAGGTVTALGGKRVYGPGVINGGASAGPDNSGRGPTFTVGVSGTNSAQGADAQWIVAGDSVTPGASIAVTVGAGGATGTVSSGTAAGGSGYVYIEYYE